MKSQEITAAEFAKYLDHSLLQPQLTDDEVRDGCLIAVQYRVASACVKPCHVTFASDLLRDSGVFVSTVVGFPHGTSTTRTKLAEAAQAIDEGAVELDCVINYGRLRSGQNQYVADEIEVICRLAHSSGARVKVIFENAWLSDEEKLAACRMSDAAGADWVKTSTGFAPTGATLNDIALMRANVSKRVQVKAAHGVRTLKAALEMIDAGVTRIGATATVSMCEDFKKWKNGDLEV